MKVKVKAKVKAKAKAKNKWLMSTRWKTLLQQKEQDNLKGILLKLFLILKFGGNSTKKRPGV